MNNLTDIVEHWLQGKVNDAVAGHTSRIASLEDRVSRLSERLEKLENSSPEPLGLSSHVEHLNQLGSELLKRVTKLDQAYSDMATMKDLQKDTRPEVLMDKLHSAIVRLLKDFLQEYVKEVDLDGNIEAILDRRLDSLIDEDYVKEVDLEENVEAILARQPQPCAADKLDARRYRWLQK